MRDSPLLVPNVPYVSSHLPAGWRELAELAFAALDRSDPGWRLIQIKQSFGGLRIYYSVPGIEDRQRRVVLESTIHEIELRSLHVCDVCGEAAQKPSGGLRSRTRCPRHLRAADRDTQLELRTIKSLSPAMRGAWLVRTERSLHLWDLDEMTYTRRPGPSDSGFGGMHWDGRPMPITHVAAWPSLGDNFIVWFDDPEDSDQREHCHSSTAVLTITQSDVSGSF